MNLTFSTIACMDWEYEKIFKTAKSLGMDTIEFRVLKDFREFLVDGRAEALAGLSQEYNISILDIAASFLLNGYDAQQLEGFEEICKIAFKLKAKGIRVFLGNFLTCKTDKGAETDYNGLVKMLKELSNIAAEYQTGIWIETHNEFSTGKILRKLLDDVNKENVKIIWDIMHPYEEHESYQDTYGYLGEKIAHIHIKDGLRQQDENLIDFLYTKLGEGELPVAEIVRYCENLGYSGYYSLEWEPMWKKELEGYDTAEIFNHYADFMNSIANDL